jgi:polysaccharide biosynthesis protein PslG
MIAAAPLASDPAWGSKAIDFVRANAPDTFDGEPVNFFSTFGSTVTLNDAFPQGDGDTGLLPLLNLQLWGLPTSKPAYDPTNHEFIYLRFQRGVMHYDKGCKCTRGLLLTDYLKAVLTGNRLPDDLAAEAASSPLLRAVPSGRALRATTFGDAFTVQAPVAPPTTATAPAAPLTVASPDYGMSAFIWGHPDTTNRDLKLVTDAAFHWQKTLFQWRSIEGGCKGCFDWSEADRVVTASAAAGVNIIARIDFQPAWARADGAPNGPPDNFQDYADFVSAFVSRYSSRSTVGRVAAIEAWNEPNLDREWGGATIDKQQAAEYVKLLGLAYAAAKAADPNVIVISAGLSPTGTTNGHSADDVQYLQWLYDAGLKGKFDVLGAHGNVQAPEVDAAFGSLAHFPHPSFYFRRIEQLRDVMVKNGDADKRVWLLEFGWTADQIHPTYSWYAVSEEKKGSNIVQALQYARQHWQPWIGVMTLWTLPDPTWTPEREEYWWAITNTDGTARPAYTDVLQARHNGVLS